MVAWSPIKKNVRDFPCLEVRSSMRTFLLKSSLFDSVCIQVVYERATTDLSSSNLRTKTPCCGLGSQTEAAQRIEANGACHNVRSNVDAKKGGWNPLNAACRAPVEIRFGMVSACFTTLSVSSLAQATTQTRESTAG